MTGQANDDLISSDGKSSAVLHSVILNRIIRGRMPPGTRVLERELVVEFAVSRTPVREALQRLRHDGFLVAQASNAAREELRVSPLPWGDVAELWQVIGALEAIAAGRVAHLPRNTASELADRLREANAVLRLSWKAAHRDPDLVFTRQARFHRILVEACSGPRLLQVYEAVRPHIERYEWLYGSSDEADVDASLDEHDAITAAVGEGNGQLAAELVADHWHRAAQRSTAVLRTMTEVWPTSRKWAGSLDRLRPDFGNHG